MDIQKRLEKAINNQDTAEVKRLVEEDKADVNFFMYDAYTALHLAVKSGNQDVVRYLIENKADVNFRDERGKTPLYWAVERCNQPLVACLVEYKADVNICNKFGDTPLCQATESGNQDTVKYLIENKADANVYDTLGKTLLYRAVKSDDQDMIEYLIKHNVCVNKSNKNGDTALHLAASRGNQTLVAYLIENKAQVNAHGRHGNTPLHLAVISQNPNQELIKYLMENGANLNVLNQEDKTPLYCAIKQRNISILQLLLEHGAYSYQHQKTEQALELWIEQWKMLGDLTDNGKKCAITMMLAGVPIKEDILPDDLKLVKGRIEKAVKQSLNFLELSQEHIPSVLRILPKIFELSDDKSLSRYLGHDVTQLWQSGSQGLKKYNMPNELITKTFSEIIDKPMVNKLTDLYPLKFDLMYPLWCQVTMHLKAYNKFRDQLFRHDWQNANIPLPKLEISSQQPSLSRS